MSQTERPSRRDASTHLRRLKRDGLLKLPAKRVEQSQRLANHDRILATVSKV
jgi:hypothetical protein